MTLRVEIGGSRPGDRGLPIAAACMIVLRDDPEVVPDAIRLARATFRAIRRNLACSYNRQYPEVFVSEGCGVLSLAPTGQHRLVPCFNNLGRIQDSQFTPLPGIPGQAGCWSTAW